MRKQIIIFQKIWIVLTEKEEGTVSNKGF